MPTTLLIRNGLIVDGTGAKARRANLRVTGSLVAEITSNSSAASAEIILDATGKIVAPGFIDTHSHADGGLLENPTAETQIRQGITTTVVGQDGGSHLPLADWFARVEARKAALNVASFVGLGELREKVLGDDLKRPARPEELRQMRALLAREMKAGALGLSSGLEYDSNINATEDEVVALAEVAGIYGGLYISHVRDEETGALQAFQELIRIAERGRLPAQISHIKLAAAPVWGKSKEVFRLMDQARARGIEITADLYPYTFWQSGITVLCQSQDRSDRGAWERGIAEVGGPQQVRLTVFSTRKAWEGKTLAELSKETGKDPISLAQEITGEGGGTVAVTAMREEEIRAFIRHPPVMFCTDGGLNSTHPRGAGSYPRVLGRYVRDERLIPVEEAIRKMTSFPARRMNLPGRGVLAPGYAADIVLFDQRTVRDTATLGAPKAAPVGITDVLVAGVPVLRDGKVTGELPGGILRRSVLRR